MVLAISAGALTVTRTATTPVRTTIMKPRIRRPCEIGFCAFCRGRSYRLSESGITFPYLSRLISGGLLVARQTSPAPGHRAVSPSALFYFDVLDHVLMKLDEHHVPAPHFLWRSVVYFRVVAQRLKFFLQDFKRDNLSLSPLI